MCGCDRPHDPADTLSVPCLTLLLLDGLGRAASGRYEARIWFARIRRRRWSYIAGSQVARPHNSSPERIRLNGNLGLVADHRWGADAVWRGFLVAYVAHLLRIGEEPQ